MARSGSFGSSLNPFGTGSLSNLGQYSIGDSLKDLEAYKLEIEWGNGDISDAEYQASLAKLVAAADPGTTAKLSAQNKLDDVTYRIGRSKADAAGLDSLIVFDQQSLSGMDANNLKYRDVKSNLDSEMAQRRSRDYGVLVAAYNAGDTSTESLLAWVQNTLASLPSDAPDKDNWDSVNATLTGRVVDEKDAQIYQDYQDRKITPTDFLAYLTGRRDAVDPSSPQWDKANQRLLDAQKNVKDTAQAVIDQDVADKYTNGTISDHTYLVWLQKRVEALPLDDPTLPAWKQRFTQAAHSLAEDKLQKDVTLAKTAAAQNSAVANLRSFYQAYALTLNHGSAEYRSVEVNINALKPAVAVTGGKATGSKVTGGKTTTTAEGAPFADLTGKVPKIILPTASFDAALGMLTPNAYSPKKTQATAVAVLRLNLESATAAAKDKVWLYHDPRYPNQTVAARNPDGTLALDSNGKSYQVRGSSYRATSSDEIAGMQEATASYSYALANIAYAKGDLKAGATAMWHANIALDTARSTQARAVLLNTDHQLAALDTAITTYTGLNDPATVVALLRSKLNVVADAKKQIGTLDQAQLDRLDAIAIAVESNPLLPVYQPDANGNNAVGPDGRNIQIGGAVNADLLGAKSSGATGASVLNPGWHYVLNTDPHGNAAWEYKYEDPQYVDPQGRTWGNRHVTVQTASLGQIVTGEVTVQDAAVVGLWVTTQDGTRKLIPYPAGASYISFKDGYGNLTTAYSFDGGQTWVQATGGQHPQLELNGAVVWNDDPTLITDANGNLLFDKKTGAINPDAAPSVGWYGQAAAQAVGYSASGVGAVGQQFRISTLSADADGNASLNLIPSAVLDAYAYQNYRAGERGYAEPTTAPQVYAYELKTSAAAKTAKLASLPNANLTDSRLPAGQNSQSLFAAGVAASLQVTDSRLPTPGIVNVGASSPPAVVPPVSLPPTLAPITDSRLPAPAVPTPTLKTVSTAPPKVPTTPVSSAALKTSAAAKTAKLASIPAPITDSRLPAPAVPTAAQNLKALQAKTGGGQ